MRRGAARVLSGLLVAFFAGGTATAHAAGLELHIRTVMVFSDENARVEVEVKRAAQPFGYVTYKFPAGITGSDPSALDRDLDGHPDGFCRMTDSSTVDCSVGNNAGDGVNAFSFQVNALSGTDVFCDRESSVQVGALFMDREGDQPNESATTRDPPCDEGGDPAVVDSKIKLKEAQAKAARESLKQAVAECRDDAPFRNGYSIFFGAAVILALEYEACRDDAFALYTETLNNIDPPDAKYGAVALPERVTPAKQPSCAKARRGKRAACRRFTAAVKSVAAATSDQIAIERALYPALNRGSTAEADKNAAGANLQDAVLRAYSGELALAVARRDAAERKLAAEFKRKHVRTNASLAQVRKTHSNLVAGKLPKPVMKYLAKRGISATEFSRVAKLAPAFEPAALDLRAVLLEPGEIAGYDELREGLEAADLRRLVDGLAQGGALTEQRRTTLAADADKVAAGEAGALDKFVADAAAPGGEATKLLQTAAASLR